MATALWALRSLPSRSLLAIPSRHTCRTLHVSSIAHRAKKSDSGATAVDTLFDDAGAEDAIPAAPLQSPTGATSPAAPTRGRQTKSRQLSPAARTEKFENLLAFLSSHIGRKFTADDAKQVRSSAWIHLFGLATNEEQLKRVAAEFWKFEEGGRKFQHKHVEAFVRRCDELKCPTFALQVFSDRKKYHFELSSPAAARHLLYMLQKSASLSSVMTLVALYGFYGLPSISTDPVASALLIAVCLRGRSNKQGIPARTVAKKLIPAFQRTLEKTPPMPVAVSPRLQAASPERTWMRWALYTVEESLRKRGSDVSWIRDWRERSGHVLDHKKGRIDLFAA
ncbi:hypothetical protein FA95DRAFT_1608264 [Auriscalpium vulgare]|uniref:Uncharacterized protein n=1 Tax=Auriscalpium vulgare TaxID=40419 RepID=A0ACB8RKM1_9AGAM|nr:hypothetical protein FA95DRAFT_1608264 [Auriscalpium vulgare]